ncbi:hypothetical protein DL93DRAFT_1788360 [Clavulina sp. PMI_390]|nr:hypothetical protein DL93DRAFT_1788360 [Clavulina sp. PMI_390]
MNPNATKKTSTTATQAAPTNTKSKNSSKPNAPKPPAEKRKTILTAWLATGPKGSARQPIVIPSSSPPPPDTDAASTHPKERTSQPAARPELNPTSPAAPTKSSQPLVTTLPPRKIVDLPRSSPKSSTSKTTPHSPRRPSTPLTNVTGGQKSVASSRPAPTPVPPSPKRARISPPTTATATNRPTPSIPLSQSSSRPRPSSDTTRGAGKIASSSNSTSRSAPSQPSKPPPTSQPRPQPPPSLPLTANDHVTHARSSGLHNTLNDCYSLAALQTVFLEYQPVYHVHDGPCDLRRVSCALKDIMQAMGDNPDAVVDPATFKAACEREGWRFGGQDDVAAFLEWLTRRLDGELGPSISVVSDEMCADCKCPYVRQAYAACIAIEPSNGSSTQELLDHWEQQEIKATTLYSQDRCDHGADVNPSRVVEIGDHLAVFIPRAEKDRVTNVKSISIDKTVRLRIPPRNDSPELVWTGYPISVISFHGVDNAGHYTATVFEDGGWSFKNDALSSRLPGSPDPRLPHSPIHHHSISSTATLVVFRKFANVNPLAFISRGYVFTTLDSAKSEDEDENDLGFEPSPDVSEADELAEGSLLDLLAAGVVDATFIARGQDYSRSTNPVNVKRREDRRDALPELEVEREKKASEKLEYIATIAALACEIDDERKEFVDSLADRPAAERVTELLGRECLLERDKLEELKPVLSEAVKDPAVLDLLDAMSCNILTLKAVDHLTTLRKALRKALSSHPHPCYLRRLIMTVREALGVLDTYMGKHRADRPWASVIKKALLDLDPDEEVGFPYIGETSTRDVFKRHLDDLASVAAGNLPTRLGNMLQIVGDTYEIQVYEIQGFPFVNEGQTPDEIVKQSKLAENLLITLCGPYSLNSADGGFKSSKLDLNALAPQVLDAETQVQSNAPVYSPAVVDDAESPDLAERRRRIRQILDVDYQYHLLTGGKPIAPEVLETIKAGHTSFGLSTHGNVATIGLYKDITQQELREGSMFDNQAGPGPTVWHDQSERANQLPSRFTWSSLPIEDQIPFISRNDWAYFNIFPHSRPKNLYHAHVISLAMKIEVADPGLLRAWGGSMAALAAAGAFDLPNLPAVRALAADYTLPNLLLVLASLPGTSWWDLLAGVPFDHWERIPFLDRVGTLFICRSFQNKLRTCWPSSEPGWGKYDPSITKLAEELLYITHLGYRVVAGEYADFRDRGEAAQVANMNAMDEVLESYGLPALLKVVKDAIFLFFLNIQSLRATDSARNQLSPEQHERLSIQMSRGVQIANHFGLRALHPAHSEERAIWVNKMMAERDLALKFRLPAPFPNLLADPSLLSDWLVALAEGKLVIRSLNGKNGHVALDKRKDTPEGREAIKRQAAKTGKAHMRRLRPDGALSFNEDNWRNTQSAPQAVKKLVDANFGKNQPRDSVPEVARCQCGDAPIITGASVHRCPLSSDPSKFVPVAELAREGHLQSVRVLTPYEVLSSPLGHSLPDGFLERERLVQLPSAACLPSSIVIPPMTPECEAAWNDSYVIVHNDPNRSPESGILQAILNLASCIHRPLRQVDLIFRDICDPGIYRKLCPILLGLQPDAQIWEVNCKRCPQKKIATSRQGKGQRVYTPQKHQHQRRPFFPDGYPRLIGDAAAVEALSDGLRTHGDARHEGKVGQEYRSFWELPLMVKKAYIHACFFSDAVLAKEFEEGGKVRSLVGQVVRVVNWRRKPRL